MCYHETREEEQQAEQVITEGYPKFAYLLLDNASCYGDTPTQWSIDEIKDPSPNESYERREVFSTSNKACLDKFIADMGINTDRSYRSERPQAFIDWEDSLEE